MLDQNTDRMWFVIGAVIVGAAIIFIANGSLPTLFASVADTFDGSSSAATEVISEIHPNVMRKEEVQTLTLADMYPWADTQMMSHPSENSVIFSPDEGYKGGLYFTSDQIKRGVKYSLEFDIQKLSGELQGIGGHLTLTDNVVVRIDGQRADSWSGYPVPVTEQMMLGNEWHIPRQYPDDYDKHHIEIEFTGGNSLLGNNERVYIQPNRSGTNANYLHNALVYEVLIENVTLYQFIEEGAGE